MYTKTSIALSMEGAQMFVLSLCSIFAFFYLVDLAPANIEGSSNDNNGGRHLFEDELSKEKGNDLKITTEKTKMQSRILRLSPAGANLTNYSLQWIPLLTVLTSPTVYYPPIG